MAAEHPLKNKSGIFSSLALVVVVVSSLAVRFYHLSGKVFAHPDESAYSWSALHFAKTGHLLAHVGRPLNSILVGILFKIFGTNPLVANDAMVVFAGAALLLFYLWGKRSSDQTAGLLSAFYFGFSPLLIYFARVHMTHMTAIFFLGLAGLSYISSIAQPSDVSRASLIRTGLFLGCTFASSGQAIFLPLMFWVADFWNRDSFKAWIRRSALWLSSFFLVLFSIEGYILFKKAYGDWGSSESFLRIYASRVLEGLRHGGYRIAGDPLYYVRLLGHFEGKISLFLFLISTIYYAWQCLRRRCPPDRLLVLLCGAGTFFMWSLYAAQGKARIAHGIALSLPMMYLMVGLFWSDVIRNASGSLRTFLKIAMATTTLGFFAESLQHWKPVLSLQTEYPQAFHYLQSKNPSALLFAGNEYEPRFYFDGLPLIKVTLPQEALEQAEKRNISWMVVTHISKGGPWDLWSKSPDRVFRNPSEESVLLAYDEAEWLLDPAQDLRQHPVVPEIRIYHLNHFTRYRSEYSAT